jgi:hypothetical protein
VKKEIAMRTARFRHLLDAHGPELTQWPAELAGAARKLVLRDASAAQELEAAQRLERLLAGHLRAEPNHGGRAWSEGDTVSRIVTAMEPLPPQRRGWLASWWPAELLEFDLAPAWSRLAVLAGVASLGFMVGLTDANLPGLRSKPAVVSEGDLSMIVFEPDPLSGMRP